MNTHKQARGAAVLITTLAVGVLAACSQASPAPAGTAATTAPSGGASSGPAKIDGAGRTITALVPQAGAGLADQYKKFYDALGQKFTQDTGATVEWQYYASTNDANTIVQTSLASGSGPDLLDYGSSFGGTYAATGGFHVLTQADWDAVGGRDSFLPSMVAMSGASPDAEVGIPHTSAPYAMAYNTAMFQAAGITDPPTTWDDFVADAKKIQDANPGVYGVGWDPADGTDPWKFIWSYARQLGGDFVSKDDKTATLNSPEVAKALDFYFGEYYREKIVPPDSLGWKNAEMTSAFLAGKVAMLPIATQAVATAAAGQPIASDIAFAPLPSVPAGMTSLPPGGTPSLSIVAGRYWAIPQYAEKNLDLALALVKDSVSTDIEKIQYDVAGWAPTTVDGLQAIESEYPQNALVLGIIEKMEPTAFTGAWATIQSGIGGVVTKAANRLAETGSWDAGAVQSDLDGANASAQRQM